MAYIIYNVDSISTGVSRNLKDIPVEVLSTGDRAHLKNGNEFSVFVFNSVSVDDEDLVNFPRKIHPADFSSSGVWEEIIPSKNYIDEIEASLSSDISSKENSFTKNSAFNKNFGTDSDTVCQGNDARLSDARTPTTHSHTITDPPSFEFRNKIIGGNFSTNPWQRGTTFTAPTYGYSADRFSLYQTTGGVCNISRIEDAPTIVEAGVLSRHCLCWSVTTAASSISSSQLAVLMTSIEGNNCSQFGFGLAGTRYATLSFWVKATKTGTYSVTFSNYESSRTYIAEYTVSISDTWEKKVITIPVDNSGTWGQDTGCGLGLFFIIACGSAGVGSTETWLSSGAMASANQVNGMDSTSNLFKIALVQLEPGTVAGPFEARPYTAELMLCQRYYYNTVISNAFVPSITDSSGSTLRRGWVQFPCLMRATPTCAVQATTNGSFASSCPNIMTATPEAAAIMADVISGSSWVRLTNLIADAEI